MSAKEKQSMHYTPQWVSLVAGGFAGGVEAAVTYPFEYAKTRVQLLHTSTTATPSNPLRLILHVAKHEGIGSLYTGCSTLILGTTAKAAVRFVSYDTIKNSLADESGSLSSGRGILAGVVAGGTESVLAVTPTERIKTALFVPPMFHVPGPQFANLERECIQAGQVLVRTQGVSELYRGLVSTTLKQSATSAVRMGTYNILKEVARSQEVKPGVLTTFGMGSVAGVVTVYATQPFDSIKTRAQSAQGASFAEAFQSVVRDHGLRGFWKGSTMRLGRLVLSGGIVFSVYEETASILQRFR